jgi:putative hydrolase of the HAD superfamily
MKFEMLGITGVKGIIFDCYNTLIDIRTEEDNLSTYEFVAKWMIYKGVKIDPHELMSEYKRMVKEELERRWEKYPEVRVDVIFGKICKNHSIWAMDETILGMEAACAFRAGSLRRFQLFSQSFRLLKELEDYPMAIVSNGQRVFSEFELRYFDIYDLFKVVIFSSDFGHKKPDPRIFIEATKRLKLEPEEILSIGDNLENDIVPSTKLGMKAMHIEEAWKLFNVG